MSYQKKKKKNSRVDLPFFVFCYVCVPSFLADDHNRAAAKELRVVIKCILDNLRDAIQLLQSVEEVPESAIQMLTQAINGVYESKAYI